MKEISIATMGRLTRGAETHLVARSRGVFHRDSLRRTVGT